MNKNYNIRNFYYLIILFVINCYPGYYVTDFESIWCIPEDVVWYDNPNSFYKIEELGNDLYRINDSLLVKAKINPDMRKAKPDTIDELYAVDTLLSFDAGGLFSKTPFFLVMNKRDSSISVSADLNYTGSDVGDWTMDDKHNVYLRHSRFYYYGKKTYNKKYSEKAVFIYEDGEVKKILYNKRVYRPYLRNLNETE
jgi:hypothetical protein